MFNGSAQASKGYPQDLEINNEIQAVMASSDILIGIEEVQRTLNRSRASVYRYSNTDTRNINPAFNPRKLNPEFRTDQKDPLLFHPNEVARFAKDILRIKEVNVEVLNSPSTVTQNALNAILEELKAIRMHLESSKKIDQDLSDKQSLNNRSVA
tara:strand:- start:18 stop:479 length:462 start_codon:yes stop_codon:yes gene_type:complete